MGFQLHGSLPAGTTTTDLVLTATQMLREHGAVGKFMELHGDGISIYAACMRYQRENVPLAILARCEYGTVSSRDWAANGTRLLGGRAVIVQSLKRIHRSNLIGFGVLPLQFVGGVTAGGNNIVTALTDVHVIIGAER